jgi:transcriptional accessory protein Tex/SPT6
VLREGDVVTLRVIKVDPENHRIGLSLRKVGIHAVCRYGLADLRMNLAMPGGTPAEDGARKTNE